MRRLDRAAADVERRGDDAIDAERLERIDGANDVDDRIESAYFVQMHVLERGAVNGCFRRAELQEQLFRAGFTASH